MAIGQFYFTTAANPIKIIEEQDEEINRIYFRLEYSLRRISNLYDMFINSKGNLIKGKSRIDRFLQDPLIFVILQDMVFNV